MKARLKYACEGCKTVSEHFPLKRNRAMCPKCGRKTRHVPVSGPQGPAARPHPGKVAAKPSIIHEGGVTVTHVPVFIEPEPTRTAEPSETPGPLEEKWPEEEPASAVTLSPDAWTDLYGMPAEAVSLALEAPQLKFSDETCRLQGARISRFCIRHNIVLPPYLDAVPIAGRALSDYAILFAKMKVRKTGKAPGATGVSAETGPERPERPPEEVKIPESSVEHVSSELPSDFDERLKKTLKRDVDFDK